MDRSDDVGALFEALSKAQGELKNPVNNKTVNAGRYSYDYASLDLVLELIRSVFSRHGLCFFQLPRVGVNILELETVIGHSSGQWIGETLVFEVKLGKDSAEKALGSAITYLRRYAISAMVGIASEEDDDSEMSSAVSRSAAQAPTPAPAKPFDFDAFSAKVDKAKDRDALTALYKRNVQTIQKLDLKTRELVDQKFQGRAAEFEVKDDAGND